MAPKTKKKTKMFNYLTLVGGEVNFIEAARTDMAIQTGARTFKEKHWKELLSGTQIGDMKEFTEAFKLDGRGLIPIEVINKVLNSKLEAYSGLDISNR